MKFFWLFLSLILFSVSVSAACSSDLCLIVRNDEVIPPNVDVNFLQLTTHDGLESFDFDLNISIRNPNGTYSDTNTSAVASERLGVWYHQVTGGYSTLGTYTVIWNAEHLTNSVPDGNRGSDLWHFTIANQDLNVTDLNSYIDSKLNDLNTGLANQLSDVNEHLDSEINSIGTSTLFEDDLNAYTDSTRTILATSTQIGNTLYLSGRGDSTTLPQTYSTVSQVWFVESDTNNLVESTVKWLLVRENGDLLAEIVVPDVNTSKTHRLLLSAKDEFGGLSPNVFSGEYKTNMSVSSPPVGDSVGGLSLEQQEDFVKGNIPGLKEITSTQSDSSGVEEDLAGVPIEVIASLGFLLLLGLFVRGLN